MNSIVTDIEKYKHWVISIEREESEFLIEGIKELNNRIKGFGEVKVYRNRYRLWIINTINVDVIIHG